MVVFSVFICGVSFTGLIQLGYTQNTEVEMMTVGYQGFLADPNQRPLSGNYTLTFRLYTTATQGETIWEELHIATPVEQGRFAVDLGSITPWPSDLDSQGSLYLGLTVDTADELSPRLKIGASLRSRWAEKSIASDLSLIHI